MVCGFRGLRVWGLGVWEVWVLGFRVCVTSGSSGRV